MKTNPRGKQCMVAAERKKYRKTIPYNPYLVKIKETGIQVIGDTPVVKLWVFFRKKRGGQLYANPIEVPLQEVDESFLGRPIPFKGVIPQRYLDSAMGIRRV